MILELGKLKKFFFYFMIFSRQVLVCVHDGPAIVDDWAIVYVPSDLGQRRAVAHRKFRRMQPDDGLKIIFLKISFKNFKI